MPDSQTTAAHYDAFYTGGDFAKPPGFADAVAAQLRRWLPVGARLLEAGCGTGALVEACRARGLAASGFDLSRVGLRRAAGRSPGCVVLADALAPPSLTGARTPCCAMRSRCSTSPTCRTRCPPRAA